MKNLSRLCSRLRSFALQVCASLLIFSAVHAQLAPVKVFVGFSKIEKVEKIDKDTLKRLKAKRDVARKEAKELEKQLKNQYGKKKELWPLEKQEELQSKEEAEALANAEVEYVEVDPEGLSDSAQDIIESLKGKGLAGVKENMQVVDSPEEADLIVEVIGRRSEKTLPTQIRDDLYYVCFKLSAGPKLDPDKFAQVPRDWRFRKFGYRVWKLQAYSPEAPFWRFEAFGDQRWGNAANAASVAISKFVGDNFVGVARDE